MEGRAIRLAAARALQGRYSLVNQAFAKAYGSDVDNLIGKKEADILPNKEEAETFFQDDLEVMQSNQEKFIQEEERTDIYGNVRRMQTVKLPLSMPGKREIQVLGVSTDITYTFQDSLTKLPNRRVFLDRLNRVLKRSHRHKNAYNAVFMLDLDRFALVNESYGHSAVARSCSFRRRRQPSGSCRNLN